MGRIIFASAPQSSWSFSGWSFQYCRHVKFFPSASISNLYWKMCDSLVIEVIHSSGGHLLSQTKYFPGLPASAAFTEDNVVDTHLRSILRWNTPTEFFPIPPIIDRLLVSRLFYRSRPNVIVFMFVSQFVAIHPLFVGLFYPEFFDILKALGLDPYIFLLAALQI